MNEQHLSLKVPNDLFVDALETARSQGRALSDLMLEALADCVEIYQKSRGIAERVSPNTPSKSRSRHLNS